VNTCPLRLHTRALPLLRRRSGARGIKGKRATTTSRRALRPTDGVWQGVNRSTGSAASTVWVDHSSGREIIVFISIDGQSVQQCRVLDLGPHPPRGVPGRGETS
jgi:hypothetical protein